MFDFDERRKFCIDKMKQAYHVGMQGDDPRVLDGSWKEVFGYEIEGRGEVRDETNGVVLEDGRNQEVKRDGDRDEA